MENEIITITINNTVNTSIFNIRLSDLRDCDAMKVIDNTSNITFEIEIKEWSRVGGEINYEHEGCVE